MSGIHGSLKETFTSTGAGAVTKTDVPFTRFGLQVKGTSTTATTWAVSLDVSLDGTNYASLLQHASADGDADGGIVWTGANDSPALFYKTHVTSLTLGSATNIIVTSVGLP